VSDLASLLWLLLLLAACWYGWLAFGRKEAALAATRRYCADMDVVLLDDTVVLRRVGFRRDARGQLRMRRRYVFEFTTTGDERYLGCIAMVGDAVEAIQLAPHRLN